MELMTALVFGIFIFAIVQSVGQWIKNENSPVLTVSATIVDMRRKTHHHHSNGHHHHTHSYHITFEVENGERMELRVHRSEYGELAVGDRGALTYQGTRYLGFER